MAKRLRSLGDLRSTAQEDTNTSSRCDSSGAALWPLPHRILTPVLPLL
jgi:hypothetical protein